MIPLELVLAILDMIRAETLKGLIAPGDRTEFGFGALHGQLVAIDAMTEKLTDAVEQRDTSEADDIPRGTYDKSSGQDEGFVL